MNVKCIMKQMHILNNDIGKNSATTYMAYIISQSQGLFVAFVQAGYPAALAGLRFGDQILQIKGKAVAGWDTDKVHNFLKKLDDQRIEMAVRDRYYVCFL